MLDFRILPRISRINRASSSIDFCWIFARCSFRISPGRFFLSRDTKRVTNPSADPRAKLNIECVLFVLMRGDFEESSAGWKRGGAVFSFLFFRKDAGILLHDSPRRERESGRFIIVATTRFVLRFELKRLVSIKQLNSINFSSILHRFARSFIRENIEAGGIDESHIYA